MVELERSALVWGVCGNLGGGKTMSAVKIAVESMSQGYFVVSNIWLNLDRISLIYGDQVRSLYKQVDLESDSPFDFPCGDPRGSGGKRRVVVVLDECAEFLDQYSSGSAKTKDFMSWLRHSSKRSQDVFFVVQRQEYLAKTVRLLVARWVWVDDLAVWRMPILRIKLPFCSGYVAQNIFDRQGSRITGVSFISKSYWGAFYDTAQIISSHSSNLYVYIPPDSDLFPWIPHFVFWLISVVVLLRNL